MKAWLSKFAAWLWWHLPFKRRARQAIKTALFSWPGCPFKSTRTYKNWAEMRKLSQGLAWEDGAAFPAHYDLTLLNRKPEKAAAAPTLRRAALVIHAFYPDIFERMLARIEAGLGRETAFPVKAWVSTTAAVEAHIRCISRDRLFPIEVKAFPNHGRDVLPFLRLAAGIGDEDALIVKLHTKKSNHRLTGGLWREELLAAMLAPGRIARAMAYFNEYPGVGLIGPAGHIVPMSLYAGGNAQALRFFGRVFDVPLGELRAMNFAAGGMFFARPAALRPLLSLEIPDAMFEAEAGQSDGTMAHAIERVYSLSARFQGLTLADTTFPKDGVSPKVTEDHPFTW